MTIERRASWKRHAPELRAAADGSEELVGYAAVFNRYSQDMGGWVEMVAPGAFAQTITQADIYGLFNHNPDAILGLNTAEPPTMRLEEDVTGLRYEVDLDSDPTAEVVRAKVKRGELRGSSFGFMTLESEWSVTEQDMPLRVLKSVRLFDVGPVTYPAYLATQEVNAQVALRSLADITGAPVEELVDAAARRELRSYIGAVRQPEPEQPSTPLALARRRMELNALAAPSAGR